MIQLFRKKPGAPAIPDGRRVYAIGDVHGRLDLLKMLLNTLEDDNASRSPADVTIVMLGDLVDRGLESRGVVKLVRGGVAWGKMVSLMGNHEAVMLDVLDGNRDTLRQWLRFGGIETLVSWGVDPLIIKDGDLDNIIAAALKAVTPDERAWLWQLKTGLQIGDYYFVHAGIRPNVALSKQTDHDRLWIRDEFLTSRKRHEAMIVHGHSVNEQVEQHPNRIGIDTGAYETGHLTAIGLENDTRWIMMT